MLDVIAEPHGLLVREQVTRYHSRAMTTATAVEYRAIDWEAATREAIGCFKDLLRIDTTNPPGNERPAAEYLARLFAQEGIEHTVLESEPGRASVVARLRASHPRADQGALLLNGHLDVVPADREHWTHDPFAAVEADGCIWGRGAVDMKNMVAMSAMTLVLLKRQGAELERDVIFSGVADEEAGSRQGALFLVERHPEIVRLRSSFRDSAERGAACAARHAAARGRHPNDPADLNATGSKRSVYTLRGLELIQKKRSRRVLIQPWTISHEPTGTTSGERRRGLDEAAG